MDTIWAFRQAYEKARQIKQAQDDFCAKAVRGEWTGLGEYPEELQWEALVDVLRGRVKVRIARFAPEWWFWKAERMHWPAGSNTLL